MNLFDIGKLFIVGLSGPKLSELDREILELLQPAGVLLLKRNFLSNAPYTEWLLALEQLILSVRSYIERDKVIISIDHEGGRVHRTPPPLTHFPPAAQYAGAAFDVGRAMGQELRSLGVNISWSPSCDLNTNSQNPIIGDRAFSSEPLACAAAAKEFLRGLTSEGVLGCIKHFPGHGETFTDSHLTLPELLLTREDLFARELLPFEQLIKAGAPLVMTSHILFSKVDSQWPVTLSSTFLREILRGDLGFKGAIVTDDLDMRAILGRFSSAQTMAQALRAGCNFFIVARYPNGTSRRPLELAQATVDAVESGILTPSSIHETLGYVEEVLQQLPPFEALREVPPEVLSFHDALRSKVLPSPGNT